MTATAHHAASQRRASLTMTLFLVGLAVAIALVVFDFVSQALDAELLARDCDTLVETCER